MTTTGSKLRRVLVSGAVVAGAGLGAAGVASAATSSSTTATTPAATASGGTSAPGGGPTGSSATPPTGGQDPATLTHGPGETLLTGTELAEATAAAQAAVPGATIVRAETNSSGGYPYEVHLKKSDGTYVTVELDSSFKEVTTISGFGTAPTGTAPTGTAPTGTAPTGTPPGGAAPNGTAPSSSTSAAA